MSITNSGGGASKFVGEEKRRILGRGLVLEDRRDRKDASDSGCGDDGSTAAGTDVGADTGADGSKVGFAACTGWGAEDCCTGAGCEAWLVGTLRLV